MSESKSENVQGSLHISKRFTIDNNTQVQSAIKEAEILFTKQQFIKAKIYKENATTKNGLSCVSNWISISDNTSKKRNKK
ncbi:25421_t:CDS:2 [Dentiscutata erythropus]|uniref:25421_t:CDS:1 n=1 Tax=Dentiscutata erythropus TaxID=1348616 RepID=A0A9N8VR00_9GLOM|nr:25421_t:CDS:2 [Dentiscutata erythropus]